MNGGAAREQANGSKDGEFEHLAGRRAREAFADVVDVSDHKNRENGGFGSDEGKHADMALIWKGPLRFDGSRCCSDGVHRTRSCVLRNLLLILPIRIFRMLNIPKRAAAVHHGSNSE